ncbi:Protein of uncharacterised function (DUF968) [Enterobacter hormaechei]|nr:Protein of uncharacterised function (DUF968) [Enterobacter hormaechei]
MQNLVKWLLERVNIDLGFSPDHTLSLPEFCWWMVRNDLADFVPESVASKALRIKPEQHSSVMRESDIVPSLSATNDAVDVLCLCLDVADNDGIGEEEEKQLKKIAQALQLPLDQYL